MKINKEKLISLAEIFLKTEEHKRFKSIDIKLAVLVEEQLNRLDRFGFRAEVTESNDHFSVRIYDSLDNKISFFRDENEDVATICAILKIDEDFTIGMLPWE